MFQGGDGRILLNQLQENYCELNADATGRLAMLNDFNSASQRTLLNKIQQAWNVIATVQPGADTSPDCGSYKVRSMYVSYD